MAPTQKSKISQQNSELRVHTHTLRLWTNCACLQFTLYIPTRFLGLPDPKPDGQDGVPATSFTLS